MSAPTDNHEAVRAEKTRAIEALGLDPWGGRFDGHQPIADVLRLPADLPDDQRPRVRVAGRVVLRRDGGKVIAALEGRSWKAGPTEGRPVTIRFNPQRTEVELEPLWQPGLRAAA